MDISAIKDTILSGLSQAGNAVVNVASWAGRTVSYGFSNFVVPVVAKVWEGFQFAFRNIASFLRTGYGLGTVGLAAGTALLAAAEHKKFEGDDNYATRIALRALAGAVFVGSGIAIGVAIAKGSVALV